MSEEPPKIEAVSIPPEDDPLYMSEEERTRFLRLQETMSGEEALPKVIGRERAGRLWAAEARMRMKEISKEAHTANQERTQGIEREHTKKVVDVLKDTNPDAAGEPPQEQTDDILNKSQRAARRIVDGNPEPQDEDHLPTPEAT